MGNDDKSGRYYNYLPIPDEDKPFFDNLIRSTADEEPSFSSFIKRLRKSGFKIGSHTEEKFRKWYDDYKKKI